MNNNRYTNNLDSKNLLKESLERLVSQVSAYRDVIGRQYPGAQPMIQIILEMSKECLDLSDDQVVSSDSKDSPLSNREREVLTLVGRGLLNKEIAFILGISNRTVEFHIKSVFIKTQTQSRTEAVVRALKNGWITE